jgi:carbohydrate kinase (thermoresistant glucokinase family)
MDDEDSGLAGPDSRGDAGRGHDGGLMDASPMHIVIMGVSGSGKTTLALRMVSLLGWPYAEADDFHPKSNIDKMASGRPLTDADRWPWLESLRSWMSDQATLGYSTIVTCSALKRSYRDVLRRASGNVFFVELDVDEETLTRRMSQREHFMPVSLLRSQESTLEPLEPDESGMCVPAIGDSKRIACDVLSRLHVGKCAAGCVRIADLGPGRHDLGVGSACRG